MPDYAGMARDNRRKNRPQSRISRTDAGFFHGRGSARTREKPRLCEKRARTVATVEPLTGGARSPDRLPAFDGGGVRFRPTVERLRNPAARRTVAASDGGDFRTADRRGRSPDRLADGGGVPMFATVEPLTGADASGGAARSMFPRSPESLTGRTRDAARILARFRWWRLADGLPAFRRSLTGAANPARRSDVRNGRRIDWRGAIAGIIGSERRRGVRWWRRILAR